MKKLILSLAALLLAAGIAGAIPDPAAVYCTESGYEYENGDCVFPDGNRCDAWHYYCGCEPNGIGCWPGDFNCDFPCSQLPCKQAGEHVLVSECCEGLSAIPPIYIYDGNCDYNGMTGWTDICSDCGNGIWEVWESKCNCPQDCDSSDTNNLILWYKFDETDGNAAGDSSIYERHGYVDVDVEELPNDPNWDPNDGRYGGCLIFDDDTAVIVPETALDSVGSAITVLVWINGKVGQTADKDIVVFDAGDGEGGEFKLTALIPSEAGEVYWRAGNDSNDALVWDGIDPSWLEGDWRHFAFVKDESAGEMTIYLDALPATSKSSTTNSLTNIANKPFKIGAYNYHANDYEGKLDDFRVYDRALSYCDFWPCPPDYTCAWGPTPYDGQPDVPPDVVLTWKPGDDAVGCQQREPSERGLQQCN
jgi:hypothetical protein